RALDNADRLHLLLGAAHDSIVTLGPWAVFDRVVLTALFYWLLFPQYAPGKSKADYAARAADALLDALRPDRSRHMSRTPEQLTSVPQAFEEWLPRAQELAQLLHTGQSPRAALAKARDWFGARVDSRDLARWKTMTPLMIVIDNLKTQRGLST